MRHTEKLLIRDEDLKKLWDEDRVAIHYPGKASTRRPEDARSIKPEDYEERQDRCCPSRGAYEGGADTYGLRASFERVRAG